MTRLNVETLEYRLAPARLVSPTTLIYQDQDGDSVTVKLTKPLLTEGNVNNVFDFDIGSVDGNLPKQQLRMIDFTSLNASGAGISLVASRSAVNGGDGFAQLGRVNATGIDLGAVSIDGDLGQIDCGDSDATTVGLASLTVQSMGQFGTSTQNPFGDLVSNIEGQLTSLVVKADVVGATVDVLGDGGRIGTVTIGGSLIGGSANVFEGGIGSEVSIGFVTIKGDIVGGAGLFSGSVGTDNLGGIRVGGSVIGGQGNFSGRIAAGEIGPVKIAGDLRGGDGKNSGMIDTNSTIASVSIGGSVIGGSESTSGVIVGFTSIGRVHVRGALIGGSGANSGRIVSHEQDIAAVTIGAGIVGGSGDSSGQISAARDLGPVSVIGDVNGGAGTKSGRIEAEGTISRVQIRGSIVGGAGDESGSVFSLGQITQAKIGGDIRGGAGILSGQLESESGAMRLIVSGSVVGADGPGSAFVGSDIVVGTIRGSVLGGSGPFSGEVNANHFPSLLIGGSVIGGSGDGSGMLEAGLVDKLRILGNLTGGAGDHAGAILAREVLSSLFIGGSVQSSTGDMSGSITARDKIGNVSITGNLVGTKTAPVLVVVDGSLGNAAQVLDSLRVGGRVEFAEIRAGFHHEFPSDDRSADAQIGSILVGGDWIASTIACGVEATDAFFGNDDDIKADGNTFENAKDEAAIFSRIHSLTIRGQLVGTADDTGDSFGFVAEEIGSVSIGGVTINTNTGVANDVLALGGTDDLTLREVS